MLESAIVRGAAVAGAALCALACRVTTTTETTSWSSQDRIEGSGVSIAESRSLPPFQSVSIDGSIDTSVVLGSEQSVEVRGDDNLLDRVTTEVRGGVLSISMLPGNYRTREPLRVNVSAPALERAVIRGSADLSIEGLDQESFAVEVSGSGDVGARGRVGALRLDLRGSGDLKLGRLEAREVELELYGSGDVEVHAVELLEIRLSGSGDVNYHGDPRTAIQAHGSGNVRRVAW